MKELETGLGVEQRKEGGAVARVVAVVRQPYFLLLVLWLVLTGINLTKAFHIDDTFHLEAAAHLRENPLRPMSGLINWSNTPTPMHVHNQPPLFFYLMALYTSIFGVSEVSLHLLLSVFTILALFYFVKIAQLVEVKNLQVLLVLFALCPAFVVNQNVMTDVPVLAIMLSSVYYLLLAPSQNTRRNYLLTALLLGLGMLIKYSVLPLLVVLALVLLLRRAYRQLPILLIPLVLLALWSAWNYAEYGAIHLLDRPHEEIHYKNAWAFMTCVGSMSMFSISFLYGLFPLPLTKRLIYLVLAGMAVATALLILGFVPEFEVNQVLNWLFLANGLLVFGLLLLHAWRGIDKDNWQGFLASDKFVLLLFLGAIAAFITLLAPFIATRHILLCIPFLLLAGHRLVERSRGSMNTLALIMTAVMGIGLGISDWIYADFYRQMPTALDLPAEKTTWNTGLWGWKWYAEQSGMKRYDTEQSPVQEGDLFVFPGDVPRQKLPETIQLKPLRKVTQPASWFTFLSGNNNGSLYNSARDRPAWGFSRMPIDTIHVFRVTYVPTD